MFTLDDLFCENSKLVLDCENKDMLNEFLEYLEKYTDYTWVSGDKPKRYPVTSRYLYGYSNYDVGLCQGPLESNYEVVTIDEFVEFAKPDYSGFEDILLGE